jgi:tRNA wybutosine-synthesizing protein 1
MDIEVRKKLEKMHYKIIGKEGAVQICEWTKKAIRGEGHCYKNKFYGVDDHRCAQFSPLAIYCPNNCIYCWRPNELMETPTEEVEDDVETIYEELIKERRKLLIGFKGYGKVNKKILEEALSPNHFAISLAGEPLAYSKIGELVEHIRKKGARSIFIVTNGQYPERLEEMWKKNQLPTQLYVSMNAPNKEIFSLVNMPSLPDAWERFNRTLEIMRQLPIRRVIRLTLIKGINDKFLDGYVEQIEKAKPDFVEVKSYMFLGYSRKRLKPENMREHEEVRDFSNKLNALLSNYHVEDEQKESRIVLLMRDGAQRWHP